MLKTQICYVNAHISISRHSTSYLPSVLQRRLRSAGHKPSSEQPSLIKSQPRDSYHHSFSPFTRSHSATGRQNILAASRIPPGMLEICHQYRKLTSSTLSRCWKCGSSLIHNAVTSWDPSHKFFCQNIHCAALQPVSDDNYFQLFGLDETYDIDQKELSRRFREMQQVLHPDKTVHLSVEEQAHADAQSAAVNKAYDSLLKPVPRALYLLKLHGHSLEEGDVDLDPEFLMYIMELNEDISVVTDSDQLKTYFDKNRLAIQGTVQQISEAFKANDILHAKYLIGKIKYYVNIEDKIKEKTYFH